MGQEVRYLFYSLLLMRASGWPQQETYTCSEEGLLDGRTWDLRTDCDGRYRDKKGAPLLLKAGVKFTTAEPYLWVLTALLRRRVVQRLSRAELATTTKVRQK